MMSHAEPSAWHAPHLAHHFDTPRQQFAAGKLGMWIFLLTEVLFFGGLFCAYAVYRANHPEIFLDADKYLDKPLGAINTAVLIFSSLTMAWAVRSAQLSQRRGLVLCLALTLACAAVFLGIKYVEYRHKWEEGLKWAGAYAPKHEQERPATPDASLPVSPAAHGHGSEPHNLGIFFSIYFAMTGLHAVHVIGGMGVIAWILRRAVRGDFSADYFSPVDYTALYWHLVDMIWIYLFPLLYLIH